jgi:hypothetical protein
MLNAALSAVWLSFLRARSELMDLALAVRKITSAVKVHAANYLCKC